MIQLIYTAMFLILAGIVISSVTFMFFRKWTRGKVLVNIYTRDRRLQRHLIRPTDLGKIQVGKAKAYLYKEAEVHFTRLFFIGESFPTLTYVESKPTPIHIDSLTPVGGVSSSELSDIMNDDTVRDFVSSTQAGPSPKDMIRVMFRLAILQLMGTAVVVYAITELLPAFSMEVIQ